jgi:hypothetical protein
MQKIKIKIKRVKFQKKNFVKIQSLSYSKQIKSEFQEISSRAIEAPPY